MTNNQLTEDLKCDRHPEAVIDDDECPTCMDEADAYAQSYADFAHEQDYMDPDTTPYYYDRPEVRDPGLLR